MRGDALIDAPGQIDRLLAEESSAEATRRPSARIGRGWPLIATFCNSAPSGNVMAWSTPRLRALNCRR